MDQAKPHHRFRPPNRTLPRFGAAEEFEILSEEVELLFRGKHVVGARAFVAFIERAEHIPGLSESAERILDFFEDTDAGNWVDGSSLYRVARPDHGNRLKRIWRDFEHRRATLRQYLRGEFSDQTGADCVRMKLPEARLETPKAFLSAFRHLVAGLDRLCRLIVGHGFGIAGFRERSGWILLRPETDEVLELASEILGHFRWFREQTADVRRLEERASISEEYAKAAKSLASAQLRHLHVLVEDTIRQHTSGYEGERFAKAVSTTTEYVGILDTLVNEGAEVTCPNDVDTKTQAA